MLGGESPADIKSLIERSYMDNYDYMSSSASYEEIHGSIAPPDNTRVVIPQKELPILLPHRQVIPPREQPAIVIKPAKK
jgi:hypothetical protein